MKQSDLYRIGIDLGGTHIGVSIVDAANRIVASKRVPTVSKNGAAALVS